MTVKFEKKYFENLNLIYNFKLKEMVFIFRKPNVEDEIVNISFPCICMKF